MVGKKTTSRPEAEEAVANRLPKDPAAIVYIFVADDKVWAEPSGELKEWVDRAVTLVGVDTGAIVRVLNELHADGDGIALKLNAHVNEIASNPIQPIAEIFRRLISRPFPSFGIRSKALRLTKVSISVPDVVMADMNRRDMPSDALGQIIALDTAHLPPTPKPPSIERLEALIKGFQTFTTRSASERAQFVTIVNDKLEESGYRLRLKDQRYGILAIKKGSIQIQTSGGTVGFKKAHFTLEPYRPYLRTIV